jgi:hypothetical protein
MRLGTHGMEFTAEKYSYDGLNTIGILHAHITWVFATDSTASILANTEIKVS